MKKIDYKAMTNEELTSNYILLKRNLFNLKLQNSVGQLSNPHEITSTKKNIARILTEMTSRGIDYNKINLPVEKKKAKKASKVEKPAKAVKEQPKKVEKQASETAEVKPVKTAEKTTAKAEPKTEKKPAAQASAGQKPSAKKQKTTAKKESV